MKCIAWTLLVWVPVVVIAARGSDFTGGWSSAAIGLLPGLPI